MGLFGDYNQNTGRLMGKYDVLPNVMNYGTQGSSLGKLAGGLGSAARKSGISTAVSNTGTQVKDIMSGLYDQLAALSKQTMPKQVYLPSVNLKDIYARSRAQAEEAVSGLYSQKLADFLGQRNLERKIAGETYSRSMEDYQKSLDQYIQDATTNRERTGEDVQNRLLEISQDEALRQQAEAQQYDVTRRGAQSEIGKAGLSFSGLGKQATGQIGQQRKFTETQQTREVQRKQQEQKIFETRTFADIAKGETRKKEETETGKKRAKIDFDYELENILFNENIGKMELELKKQSDRIQREQEYNRLAFRNYISGLKGNEQIAKAYETYGGTF